MKKLLATGLAMFSLAASAADACVPCYVVKVVKKIITVAQSWDPNEMKGPVGIGEQRYVKPGEPMDYTIYFENETNATAAAIKIAVTLPKDANLDWSTLELGEVVFGDHTEDGFTKDKSARSSTYPLAGTGCEVRTTVTEDDDAVTWNLRIWTPNTTDHFPDDLKMGILPPNDPETRCGEGHISYRVYVKENATPGDVIHASASIVFDDNPAIVTDPAWWNTVYGGGAGFIDPEIVVDEGSNAVIRVVGGNESKASSVKVYLTYQTATAADVDLNMATVADGDAARSAIGPYQTNLKFPITLKWAAGEIGEKVITIPVKADALYEGDEFFTVQLAGAIGMEIGDDRVVTITIKDAQAGEDPAQFLPAGATPVYVTAEDGVTQVLAGYFTKADKKGNVTAKAMPGYIFVAWVYNSNGKTYSTKATITDKLRKSKKVLPKFAPAGYLRALVEDPATGSVKGQGLYAVGKTVAMTATPKKGYAFTGWTAGGETVSLATTYKYTVAADGSTVVASFKKESELERPVLTLSDSTGETSSGEVAGNDRTISVGVAYPATLSVAGESKVSITKVTGLPTGLKYKSGKITGIPTKAGKFTASVVVTLASNKKKTWVCKIPFTVAALPEWARGNFTGTVESPYTGEMVPATMSVASNGKISGKFALGGTNWTFSASSFAKDSVVTGEVMRFAAAMTAKGTWKAKSGAKTVTKSVTAPMGFAIVSDPATSAIAAFTEDGYFGQATDEMQPGEVYFRRNAGVSIAKDGQTAGGTVALSVALGQAASNKTVKATAKLKSGYALLGWYLVEGGETNLVSQATAYSFTMPGEDVFLVAKFGKESALARPELTWGGEIHPDIFATNLTMGVAYAAGVSVAGEAAVKISKVAGLPAGLAYKGGKVSGVPTKNGSFTAVVTVALATNAKKIWTYKVPFAVAKLPDYAKGTYTGAATVDSDEVLGLATVTVGAAGAISGKFYDHGTNWTFSAAGYTGIDGMDYVCTNLVAKYSWTVKEKVKGKLTTVTKSVSRKFTLRVDEHSSNGGSADSAVLGRAVAEEIVSDCEAEPVDVVAVQNQWGTKYKAVGSALFCTSAKKLYKEWPSVAAEGLCEYDTLSVKVTTAGVVTATLKHFKGTFDAKTKKPQYVTYACSSTMIPNTLAELGADAFTGTVPVFFPALGYFAYVDFPFAVRDVPVPTQESGEGSGSWFTGEFNGYGDAQFPAGGDTEFLNGLFTINVASSLAFTGTFKGTDGSTAAFSGTFAKDGSSYWATGVSITVKGKTMSMGLMCEPGPYAGSDEGFGEMWGGSDDVQDEPCIALNCAWQNIWKRTDLAAEWKPAFAAGTAKSIQLEEGSLEGLSEGDSLTYAFGAEGAVSITGKIYGKDVSVTAKLHLEGCDSSTDTMHCNVQFIANKHLYQQQFTFPRKSTVAAVDIELTADNLVRLD